MAGRRFLEQAKPLGAGESVGAIVDPQLAVDVQNMPLRRAVCDYQPLGDILVGQPFGQQAQHHDFLFGQRLDQRVARRC